jgi:hypothetical protein
MTEKFYLYEGRHDERILVRATAENWEYLLRERELDDGCTLEEAGEHGLEWGGSYEEGSLWVDDGGEITTIELSEPPWK